MQLAVIPFERNHQSLSLSRRCTKPMESVPSLERVVLGLVIRRLSLVLYTYEAQTRTRRQ